VELIYQPVAEGRLPVDPAFYLEWGDNGTESEFETKLLLGRHFGRLLAVSNLVGVFEFRRGAAREEEGPHGFRSEVNSGLAWEFGPRFSAGLEARYVGEYEDFGARTAALVAVGPVLSVESRRAKLTLTVMPQVWGTPASTGSRNLVDFEKTQIRAILGIEL
jgi:hypothetical protein